METRPANVFGIYFLFVTKGMVQNDTVVVKTLFAIHSSGNHRSSKLEKMNKKFLLW